MLTAVCRYGPRVIPGTARILEECRVRGETIQGPDIGRFEKLFAAFLLMNDAVATSYGRMAFAYLLRAFSFPPGAEVIVPALTFWGIPEMVRLAGLTPVPADIDPRTFTLDPWAFERAISDRTVAVVPTHLFGLPCDMASIVGLARRHGLAVIEDCAHALGARYRGRRVGTFGDAAFFSLQMLGPLNTYGGGMAVARDAAVLARVRAQAEMEPWPDEARIATRLKRGAAQRFFSRPWVFTFTAYPARLAALLVRARPGADVREPIRPLDPMPDDYRERYTNVQAAIGFASLPEVDGWNTATRAQARLMDEALAGLPGVSPPFVPEGCQHVYCRYPVYAPSRDGLVRKALRRGVDLDTCQVDLWPALPHFGIRAYAPYAAQARDVVHVPVYAALGEAAARRVARRMRSLLSCAVPASADAHGYGLGTHDGTVPRHRRRRFHRIASL